MAMTYHVYSINKAVEGERNRLTLEYQQILDESLEKARNAEQEMAQGALLAERGKNEKVTVVNRKLQRTIDRLQKRTSRTDSSTASSNSASCTGMQLYREDGEFLAREAARAERVLIERNYYYEEYERARRTMDSLANKGR